MNTRVRRRLSGERSEPHPNALSVIQHVQQYLAGAQNGEAVEEFQLAIGLGLTAGLSLDAILFRMSQLYVEEITQRSAAALGGAPDGRAESGATNARSREA